MGSIEIACPSCGEKRLKVEVEGNGVDDLLGAVCQGCGHTFTEDDVRRLREQVIDAAKELALDTVRESLRKAFRK